MRTRSALDRLNVKHLNIFAEVLLEYAPLVPIAVELVPFGVFSKTPKLLHACIIHNAVESYVPLIEALVTQTPTLLPLRDRVDNLRPCDYIKRLHVDAVKSKFALLCYCVNESIAFNDASVSSEPNYYAGFGASQYNFSATIKKKPYQPIFTSYSSESEEELIVRAVSYGLFATETELATKTYDLNKTCSEGENILYKCVSMLSGSTDSVLDTEFHSHTFDLIVETLGMRHETGFKSVDYIWASGTDGGMTFADLVNVVSSENHRDAAVDAAVRYVVQELKRNWNGDSKLQ